MSSAQRAPTDINGNRRSYIASQNFTYSFFTYKDESLTPVTEDETKCPAGRVLRESGRRLFPGSSPGINQYYVGVYDPITFLKGFIDPNGSVFAEFNTNKPNYLDDNYSDDGSDDDSLGPDAGDPVYTKGNVTAIAYNTNGSNNSNVIQLLENDASGDRAFMAFDDQNSPYVECQTSNNGSSSSAYIWSYPDNAEIYASASDISGNAQMNLSANYVVISGTAPNTGTGNAQMNLAANTVEITGTAPNTGTGNAKVELNAKNVQILAIAPGDGEATLEVRASSAGFVAAYGSDGSIYNSGVMHPYNSCGNATLGDGGTVSISIPSVSDPVVIISRKAFGGSDIGHLVYSVAGTTLTISSGDSRDRSEVSWLLLSNYIDD